MISDVDVVSDVTGHSKSDWCIIGVLVLQLHHTSVQNKRKTILFSSLTGHALSVWGVSSLPLHVLKTGCILRNERCF